ncbi:MAG TPA: hypothetical protein VFZ61_14550 [Polyangiales bacterium]
MRFNMLTDRGGQVVHQRHGVLARWFTYWRGGGLAAFGMCLVLLGAGCAHSVKEIARESSRAVVDESVDQLTEPESRQQIAEAAADPRMEQAIKNITDQVTEGVLKGMESERTQQNLAKLTSLATRTAAKQIIDTMGSPEMRAQLSEMTGALTEQVMVNLADTFKTQIVPTLRESLARDLSQVAAISLNDGQLHHALGSTMQNVAYNAVLGANDGLRSTWLGDTGDSVRGAARAGIPWLKLVFWSLLALTLCLLSAAIIVVARARRARTEVMRLEAATLLLATAMREKHANGESEEIVTVVREALEKSARDHQRHGLLGILRLRHH